MAADAGPDCTYSYEGALIYLPRFNRKLCFNSLEQDELLHNDDMANITNDWGSIATHGAIAERLHYLWDKYVTEHPKWQHLEYASSLLALRQCNSKRMGRSLYQGWVLRYVVYHERHNAEPLEHEFDDMYFHTEPILLNVPGCEGPRRVVGKEQEKNIFCSCHKRWNHHRANEAHWLMSGGEKLHYLGEALREEGYELADLYSDVDSDVGSEVKEAFDYARHGFTECAHTG